MFYPCIIPCFCYIWADFLGVREIYSVKQSRILILEKGFKDLSYTLFSGFIK
jgi:hypothetical protein